MGRRGSAASAPAPQRPRRAASPPARRPAPGRAPWPRRTGAAGPAPRQSASSSSPGPRRRRGSARSTPARTCPPPAPSGACPATARAADSPRPGSTARSPAPGWPGGVPGGAAPRGRPGGRSCGPPGGRLATVSGRQNSSNIRGLIMQLTSFCPMHRKRSRLQPMVQLLVPCPVGRITSLHPVHDPLQQPGHVAHGPADRLRLLHQVHEQPLRAAQCRQAVDAGVQVGVGGDPPVPAPLHRAAQDAPGRASTSGCAGSMARRGCSPQSFTSGATQEVFRRGARVSSAPNQAATWSGPSQGLCTGRASPAKKVCDSWYSALSST